MTTAPAPRYICAAREEGGYVYLDNNARVVQRMENAARFVNESSAIIHAKRRYRFQVFKIVFGS